MNSKPKKEKNSLSASDICKIIRQCSESGVTQLKTAEFEVNFGKPEETSPCKVDGDESPQSVENPPQTTENQLVDDRTAEKLVEEEMVATLAINDPVAWEEYELKELLHESDGRDEDRQS